MKFKLANGGVIASCKQPLLKKDFDRLEITGYDYDGTRLEDLSGESGNGYIPSHTTNWELGVEFEVDVINPSSRMIQRSYASNNRKPKISISNDSVKARKYSSSGNYAISNLHTGRNTFYVTPPKVCDTNCRTWTGFGSSGHRGGGRPGRFGPIEYWNDRYTLHYTATLTLNDRNRRVKSRSDNSVEIEYQVR